MEWEDPLMKLNENREALSQENPVYRSIEAGKPFSYFHTHTITREVLDHAVAEDKSLEVDISVGPDGKEYIGHPMSFYEFKKIPPPENLPLDDVLTEMLKKKLYLVLDCKDVRALPKVQSTIQAFGANNVLLHSWADALLFKPYPSEITIEPHWPFEDLPFDKLKEVKQRTGVPLIVSARGLTRRRLEEETDIVAKIIDALRGHAEAINFNLPNGDAPPVHIIEKLLNERILTWINMDRVPLESRPKIYLGTSDYIEKVSAPKDF